MSCHLHPPAQNGSQHLRVFQTFLPGCQWIPIQHSKIGVFAAGDRPDLGTQMSRNADVALSELVTMPMVLLDLPVASDRYLEIFRAHGLEPDVRHTVKTTGVACALVASGFGFSILNLRDPSQESASAGFVTVPIRENIYAPVYGVAFPTGVTQSRVTKKFLEVVSELAAEGAFSEVMAPITT